MAKHLASRYVGKRSSCWLKIKPARRLPCAIIGWEPGVLGLRGLMVAAPWEGQLRYVANVRNKADAALNGLSGTRQVVGAP